MTIRSSLLRSLAVSSLALTPLLASCDSEPSDPMEAARQSFAEGNHRIALARAVNAVEADPNDMKARLLVAELSMALGNPDRAITELKKIGAGTPQHAAAQRMLAEAHLANGNFRTVNTLLEGIELDHPHAFFVATSAALAQGEVSNAFALLNQGLEAFPKDARLITLDAERLYMSAKLDAAAERLAPLLKQEPGVYEAHLLAGRMHLADRSPQKAKEHFAKVLTLQPSQQGAMLALATIAADAGNKKEAVRWIEETAKYGQPSALGTLFLAQVAFENGDIDQANQMLEKVPPQLAKQPQYQRLSGMIASARGQDAMAIVALTDYLNNSDGDIVARRFLAQHLAAGNQLEKAWDVIEPALSHPQANGEILFLGLRLAEKTGQGNPAAIRAALARRDNAPSIAKPMIEAGKAIRAGDWAKADAIYTPLTKGKGAGDPALLNNAAAVKSKLGEHDAAIVLARQALKLAPSSPEIMDTLGWAIWQSGTAPSEARSLLAKARSAAPNNREIAGRYAIVHAQS